jgi:hypothetical protein
MLSVGCAPSELRLPTVCWSPGRGTCGRVLDEYVEHYQHRPHRAIDLRPPDRGDTLVADLATARIQRHKVLGGLINEYELAA